MVPYPFGIGEDCSLDVRFNLTCNTSYDGYKTPQLFIGSSEGGRAMPGVSTELRIYNISDSELRIFNSVSYTCYSLTGNISSRYNGYINLRGGLNGFLTLSEKNKFTVIGCDDYGLLKGKEGDYFSSGCIGLCNDAMEVSDGLCSGRGCCQTSITKGYSNYYEVTTETFGNHTDVWSFNPCGYAFVGEEGSFEFHGIRDLSYTSFPSQVVERIESTVPVVLDWVIAPYRSCSEATECKGNSHCYDVEGAAGGYRCRCNQGYQGNPYLDQGCQGYSTFPY